MSWIVANIHRLMVVSFTGTTSPIAVLRAGATV
jgi:hypothetical protein